MRVLPGIAICILFFSIGSLLVWYNDVRHHPRWLGNISQDDSIILASLVEPPVEKANSYKAVAKVWTIGDKKKYQPATGSIIIYFSKDSTATALQPGIYLMFHKKLQPIKNPGNPGGFDFRRYCIFQGITHQVYLQREDYVLQKEKRNSILSSFLLSIRKAVLTILRKNIPDEQACGLAEALLIGYKDDLDKDMVQSYSNTGVVHVIAISGLHLGLIYWLLGMIARPFKKKKSTRWLNAVIVIAGLWLFSLVAGAQASVTRSAVMFTFIVIAENLSRKVSIYNALAASAFLQLCYNPFWLWDVGFQLSYVAVLSIVVFMRPVYNWFYLKNKLLDIVWKLAAVSIAAQILTTPFSIFHFHQFPNYFLFTNIIAVPLSSLVVLGEIFLCSIASLPWIAAFTGKVIGWLIGLMNSYVERIEVLPGSLWKGMHIDFVQLVLLLIFTAAMAYWLLEKQKPAAWPALISILFFSILRTVDFIKCNRQKELIIYNVPKRTAIDFLYGRNYYFVGDKTLVTAEAVKNFYLGPSRIIHRIHQQDNLPHLQKARNWFLFVSKKILMLNENVEAKKIAANSTIDLLIITGSPKIYLSEIFKHSKVKMVVFDSSVPDWRMKYFIYDCKLQHVAYHAVSEQGAFIFKL